MCLKFHCIECWTEGQFACFMIDGAVFLKHANRDNFRTWMNGGIRFWFCFTVYFWLLLPQIKWLEETFYLENLLWLVKTMEEETWYCGLWKGAFWDIGYLTAEGDLIIQKNVIWGLNILLSFSCLMFWKFWVVKSPGIDLHFIFWCLFFLIIILVHHFYCCFCVQAHLCTAGTFNECSDISPSIMLSHPA